MPRISRRRFLAISAAIPSAAVWPGAALAEAPVARWQGIALGAGASLTLAGIGQTDAAPLIVAAVAEIDRLEAIFSLYRADSAISRLNDTGRLTAPPPEMLELLTLCGALHRATGGAFDPTIQPLWRLHAQCATEDRQPSADELGRARAQTGWAGLRFDTGAVTARPGMKVTLNGIAQGYIADRIAALLRDAGMTGILVDMGEIHAVGSRADGAPWRVGIAEPGGDEILRAIPLTDRAVATSAPMGTVLDPVRHIGHIVDPRTGRPGGRWRLVSVSAPAAALADGLSTAFTLLSRDEMTRGLAAYPEARLEALL